MSISLLEAFIKDFIDLEVPEMPTIKTPIYVYKLKIKRHLVCKNDGVCWHYQYPSYYKKKGYACKCILKKCWFCRTFHPAWVYDLLKGKCPDYVESQPLKPIYKKWLKRHGFNK